MTAASHHCRSARGCNKLMYYETLVETPYGPLHLTADDEALTEAKFLDETSVTNIKRDGSLAAPLCSMRAMGAL